MESQRGPWSFRVVAILVSLLAIPQSLLLGFSLFNAATLAATAPGLTRAGWFCGIVVPAAFLACVASTWLACYSFSSRPTRRKLRLMTLLPIAELGIGGVTMAFQ